ncbi:MAG TPA: adenylate/guanylate cyclase domain-containing protein [Thermodesulfobacteriota bacterium]|nr:adenylate/guanylate cyclase domain-containing protein [Deltaproteobacteria bacterium]HNR11995.1 adenylate/guanylate cyclase domain-containing protein [Thermodesulfobacteriota bacterium]HNU72470.1 adenylate/guanylate cyclase domain-containing protein [Thermodesulfobacteriota bacterium]
MRSFRLSRRFIVSHLPTVTPFRIGIIITICCLMVRFLQIGFLDQFERNLYDLRLRTQAKTKPLDRVVIVAIDEKSVDEIGRWPWPRNRIAELISILSSYGAGVVGFDIVFSEPDENSIVQQVQAIRQEIGKLAVKNAALATYLKQIQEKADTDHVLAESIARSGRVILGYFFHTDAQEARHIAPGRQHLNFESVIGSAYAVKYGSSAATKIRFPEAYAAEANLSYFCAAAQGSGYFNICPDTDGVVRQVPLVMICGGEFFPPLALRMLHRYFGEEPILTIEEQGIRGVWIRGQEIPTDENGFMLVHYRGPSRTFPSYSCADVINQRIDPQTFQDKMVIIGATAKGITDWCSTPLDGVFPGPEIHATIIDTVLQGDFLRRPAWCSLIEYGIIIILGLAYSLILPRIRALYGILGTGAFIALYLFLDHIIFHTLRIWLNLVYPMMTIASVYTGITLFCYRTEEREKAKIRDTFSVYVPPTVVAEMLRHPEKLQLGGEKKELSVLFADIRGFTTISEQLSPDELVRLLNDYFTAMTRIIFQQEGTLDKYIGDAIMAIFGAPIEQHDHALRCCRAALDMVTKLHMLQGKWAAEGSLSFDIGIGINTGIMAVGNMGSALRFDYTVLGDAVNLGSRLEGLNKLYGTHIIISEYTYEQVKNHFSCRELDDVLVTGKKLPLRIYELMGYLDMPERVCRMVRRFHQGLSFYRNQEWRQAEDSFRQVLEINPHDQPARVYLSRCQACRQTSVPENWDGIFTCKTK